MAEKVYQVIYIDKFNDITESACVGDNLKKLFGLNEAMLRKLSSGEPVVVKKDVPYAKASRINSAIEQAGGVSWVEEMKEKSDFVEHRTSCRRTTQSRRKDYRGSSILPDRRIAGRRKEDSV